MINILYYILNGIQDSNHTFKFKIGNIVAVKTPALGGTYGIGWRVTNRFISNGEKCYKLEKDFPDGEIKSACYEDIKEKYLVFFSEF